MSLEKKIEGWVEELIQDRPDLFLVNIRILNNFIVEVLIDGDEGISIDDCALISRSLGERIDEEDFFEGAYKLEVSSPGLNKPLKLLRQYKKNRGREVSVLTDDSSKLEGIMESVSEEGIELSRVIKKKGAKAERKTEFIPFEKIKKTKVLISFK